MKMKLKTQGVLFVLNAMAILTSCGSVHNRPPAPCCGIVGSDPELIQAVKENNARRIKAQIASGVSPNAVDVNGVNALLIAVACHKLIAFETLLALGANPNLPPIDLHTREGRVSVMHLAAVHEDSTYLRSALKHGGNPNFRIGNYNGTPIYPAIMANQANARLLINSGADLNHKSNDGKTPLVIAAGTNSYDLAYEMLVKGADPTLKNQFGMDLCGYIKRYGDRGIMPGSARHTGYLKTVAELKKRGLLP
jgi:ankyrin repeat protein